MMASKKDQTHSREKASLKQQPAQPARETSARRQTHPNILIRRAELAPRSLTPCDVFQLQRGIGNREVGRLLARTAHRQAARQKGGSFNLPGNLKTTVEGLSGVSLDDVQVHYDSAAPAGLHASAYTRGTDIYLGPGQEKHLSHEAWHVVQQKQGRVQPTARIEGADINEDGALEREATVMAEKAGAAVGLHTGVRKSSPLHGGRLSSCIQLARQDRGGSADSTQRIIPLFSVSNHAFDALPNRTARLYGKGRVAYVANVPTTGSEKNKTPAQLIPLYREGLGELQSADNFCLVIGLNRKKPDSTEEFQILKDELIALSVAIEKLNDFPVAVYGFFWQADAVPFGEIRDAIKTYTYETDVMGVLHRDFNDVYLHVGDPDALSLSTVRGKPLFEQFTGSLLGQDTRRQPSPDVVGGGFTFEVGAKPGMVKHELVKSAIDISMAMQDRTGIVEQRFPYISEANMFIRSSERAKNASFGQGKAEAKNFLESLGTEQPISVLHDASLAIVTDAQRLTEKFEVATIAEEPFGTPQSTRQSIALVHGGMKESLLRPVDFSRRFGASIGTSAPQRSVIADFSRLLFFNRQTEQFSSRQNERPQTMQTGLLTVDPHLPSKVGHLLFERVRESFQTTLHEVSGNEMPPTVEEWKKAVEVVKAHVYLELLETLPQEWNEGWNPYTQTLLGEAVEAVGGVYSSAPVTKDDKANEEHLQKIMRAYDIVLGAAQAHAEIFSGLVRKEDARVTQMRTLVATALERLPHTEDQSRRVGVVLDGLKNLIEMLAQDTGRAAHRFKDNTLNYLKETIHIRGEKVFRAEGSVTVSLFNEFLPIILRLHEQWSTFGNS